ncbi:MAG: WD40 repeat domain-containing protein [Acidobacteriota bacterium]
MQPNTKAFPVLTLVGALLVSIASVFFQVTHVGAQQKRPVVTSRSALQEAPADKNAAPPSSQTAAGLENYKFLFSFPHDDIVTCAAFSRDGGWLATGSEAGTVIVADLATQKQRKIEGLHPDGNGVYVLNFSPDGELLLTGGSGSKNTGQIKILQTSDYSVVQTLDAHLGHAVDFLQISNDKNWLLSADNTRINVWDFKAKSVIRSFPRLDARLLFDEGRLLVMGVGDITNQPDSHFSRRFLPDGSILFVNIIDGKITREIRTVSPQPIRGMAMVSGHDALVALAQTKEGYIVHFVDGRNHTILKSTPITPYQPEPGWHIVGNRRIDFGLTKNYYVAVYNDRRVTHLIDYSAGKVSSFDHRSQIGFSFDHTGKRFAVLGGINNAALTGSPEQHYWTVSVFSFDPKTAMKR